MVVLSLKDFAAILAENALNHKFEIMKFGSDKDH